MRDLPVRLLTIVLLLILAAVPCRASVTLADERPEGLSLAWSVERGIVERHRIVVPPGQAPVVEAPAGLGSAVRIESLGWRGLAPIAVLAFDPAAVPAGISRVPVSLRWMPRASADASLPPGLALVSGSALSAAASEALGGTLLNPSALAAAESATLADPALRPPAPPLLARGQALPARALPRSPRDPRPQAFGAARVKIVVEPPQPGRPGGPGLYRLTHAMLSGLGVTVGDVPLADLRLRTIETTTSLVGQALVPLLRHDADSDGLFGANDWIAFWGEPMIGESISSAHQRGDYTDARGYLLDAHAAQPSPEIPADLDGTPVSAESPDFLETARAEVNDLFLNATRTGAAGVDHYYWCSPERLSWTFSPGTEARRDEDVALPGLALGSSRTGSVRARLLHRYGDAAISPDHRSVMDVGTRIGGSDISGDGYQVVDHEIAGLVPGTDLQPVTTVTLRAPGTPGVGANLFELDFIEIDYPRTFDADADGRLTFRHEPGRAVTVRGLPGPEVVVLDVTRPLAPRLVTGIAIGAGTARFDVTGDGTGNPARIAVQHAPPGEPALRPAALELFPDAGLRDPANAVDVLVVGPRAWLSSGPAADALTRWRSRRQAEGFAVRLVATEDVLDEFGTGSFTPVAVAGLLAEAFATWSRPPSFALLLGDASVDYKNQLGGRILDPSTCADVVDPCGFDETAWVQHVPTRVLDRAEDTQFLGWYASDVLQALVAGNDWEPDVALGRLPARDPAEVAALLDKALAYEDLALTRPPWTGRVMLVADQIEVPIEQSFETYQDEARDAHVLPHYDVAQLYYQRDFGGDPPGPFTQELLDSWRDPSRAGAVLSYVGHGSAFRWSSDDVLLNRGTAPCRDDVDVLAQPGVPMPIVLNANCITGTFVYPLGPALLEELVRAPEGGAIAAFGPTGVTELTEARDVLNAAYSMFHGRDGRGGRVGDVVRRIQDTLAVSALVDPLPLLGNAFLGDPTLQPAVAHGPAAISLAAVPGDALVDLTWPAVPGASTYALWRTGASPAGTYELVAEGLTGTSHRDQGDPPGPALAVVNDQLYHYALEPVDAGGYPGRWSARVPARPCSAAVPQPAGTLTVTPGPCSGSITARWTASPTPGLQGYRIRIYLGQAAAGTPVRVVTVPGTFASLRDLINWQYYTFTVNPVTWCEIEGPASAPVTARVTCPLELDVPAFIPDLRLSRQGSDVALTWSPVASTVRGTPATIASYRVHRAADPAFLASAATAISDAPPASFTDAGRVGAGPSLEFYAVGAIDAAGRSGGIGHDLPQGARSVFATNLGAEWEVTWAPVRRDIRGSLTPVAAYEVYNSDAPLTRSRIEAESLVPAAVVPAPPARVPVVPGATFWFVVPVDVHGNRSAD